MAEAHVQVEHLARGDQDGFRAVVELGDQCRDRLGQLPYAVFDEAVELSRILVAPAPQGGSLLGYALYRLPRNEVSLTHLCVAPGSRGDGIARALVEAITARHGDRLGIRAKCRDDYNLEPVWTSLGFRPRASTTGRGRDRAPMTVWWKDHGHPDLFTEYEQPVELRAAIDLNIVRDLAHPQSRHHRSDFLIADHLTGRLQLVVTSGMHAEIEHGSSERRRPLIDAIDPYPVMNADLVEAASVQEDILQALRLRSPHHPKTAQDRSDLVQVAHAAAAGLSVFLTWDDALIKLLSPAVEELTGMKIMTPDHVVVHLDELANAEAFHQQSLSGSSFSQARAGAGLAQELDSFIAKAGGERRRELQERVRSLIHDNRAIHLIRSDDGSAVALYCAYQDGPAWHVPLLRLADHRMADTLARHLLWTFRQQARAVQAILVDITEPHLSPRLVQAAGFESMTHLNGHWYAPVVDVCGPSHEIAATAHKSFRIAGFGAPPLLTPGLSAHAAAGLEQAWWPAKIIDSELPCYAVPIKSSYAFELFGYPDGMTPRDTQLSLGREHVYYHSVRNSRLTEPARIRWLATGDGPGTGHFFATSKLDGLLTDTPEQLHANLSYYGVFNLAAVTKAAMNQPKAEALRISNTELFTRPVSQRRYQAHRSRLNSGPKAFYSAQPLPPQLFATIYQEGTQAAPLPAPPP
jgi:GNAT superfamily N-acetyltransferase